MELQEPEFELSAGGKFQGNFDEGKGNLVGVIRIFEFSGEFELKTCQVHVYCSDSLDRLMMSMPRASVLL